MLPIRLGGTLQWLYKGPRAVFTWTFVFTALGAMIGNGGGVCIGFFIGLFIGCYVGLIGSQVANEGPNTIWFPNSHFSPYEHYFEKPVPKEDDMRRDLVKIGK